MSEPTADGWPNQEPSDRASLFARFFGPLEKVDPPAPQDAVGFFTDATLCIGCKACEVACKEWNLLPADAIGLTGNSYDNTGSLSATTWRHVSFVEHISGATAMQPFQSNWLMMSDVCKIGRAHV